MTERKTKGRLVALTQHLAADEAQQWGYQRHLFTLTRRWPELVGSVFAGQSTPAYFRRNELWLYIRNSVWMQQMHFFKPDLLTKINALLQGAPQVDDLRWTLPPTDFMPPFPAKQEPVPLPAVPDPEAEQAFRAMAENIADPAARAALCRLWLRLRQNL